MVEPGSRVNSHQNVSPANADQSQPRAALSLQWPPAREGPRTRGSHSRQCQCLFALAGRGPHARRSKLRTSIDARYRLCRPVPSWAQKTTALMGGLRSEERREGKSVSVRVDIGGTRNIKTTKIQ